MTVDPAVDMKLAAGDDVAADAGLSGLMPTTSAPAACADLGVSKPVDGAQAFCVVLVDSAGNESEGACTAPITIGP